MAMEFPSLDLPEKTVSDSLFSDVPLVPEPPVYAVMAAYGKDPNPLKLNLGIGVYKTEEGKPCILNVVRRAEKLLANDMSIVKEYLPITGIREFNNLSAKLILGVESPAIKEKRVTTVQCVAGCGALRVGAEFLGKHYPQKTVYIPQPTYENHPNFFSSIGLVVKTYRYYNPDTHGLDFQGLLEDLSLVPPGAIVLLQACGHNPTGVDPTLNQWERIRQLMRSIGLLPFFDSAYQGLVSGDLEEDAQSVRLFVADGNECLIAQSYSKNMGLYGERVGALSIVCKTAEVASKVESQLKLVIRPMYSNPPIHGASIVTAILNDRYLLIERVILLLPYTTSVAKGNTTYTILGLVPHDGRTKDMYDEWRRDLKTMTERLIRTRQRLVDALHDRGTPGDWSHITKHAGMYSFSGLNPDQVAFVTKEYHIYMSSNGRINVSGLGYETVPRLAEAIHAAITLGVQ